jgi:hypothetical protein
MAVAKHWTVDVYIDEHSEDRTTRAETRLHTDDRTNLCGVGIAHRNPADREVPEIGDELAAARALFDLAHRLLEAAALNVRQMTHERTQPHA